MGCPYRNFGLCDFWGLIGGSCKAVSGFEPRVQAGSSARAKGCFSLFYTVNLIKLETGLRPNSAGIPYALLLRFEAIGFPTFLLTL